jgi:hypothetical protein
MNLLVSKNAGDLSSGYTTGRLWSSAQLHTVSYSVRQAHVVAYISHHQVVRQEYTNNDGIHAKAIILV